MSTFQTCLRPLSVGRSSCQYEVHFNVQFNGKNKQQSIFWALEGKIVSFKTILYPSGK